MSLTDTCICDHRTATTTSQKLLTLPDALRARLFASAPRQRQKELGQFLTPPHVAELMASMFKLRSAHIHLLDAGAGLGILSAAFVRRQLSRKVPPLSLSVTAYELDPALIDGLHATYDACRALCRRRGIDFSYAVHNADFIVEAAAMERHDLFASRAQFFDAAIVNPPYGKLSTGSPGYRLLRTVGAETTNLYTAFVGLIVRLLRPNGELVAITPRSFCNGPYFRPFRERLLAEMSLRRLHVFESRTAAFRSDSVLQENIILHAVKNIRRAQNVFVSQSTGSPDQKVRGRYFQPSEIVSPADPQAFIHIPVTRKQLAARQQLAALGSSLERLGLSVSTGRVVDFRARENICQDSAPGTCPLIYPCHFDGLFVAWPSKRGRKPNAIHDDARTRNLLIPAEVYVLTKRFTSKEERRRVVACIYDPSRVSSERVGFENHVNYIHANGKGLDMVLAKGLWAYLNSSALDTYFRQFNGHTQVNATDLRSIPFPTAPQLRVMGRRVGDSLMEQDQIDAIVTRGGIE